MSDYSVVTEGDTVTVLPGKNLKAAAAAAVAAGEVRTVTTSFGIGLVMDREVAVKADLVASPKATPKQAAKKAASTATKKAESTATEKEK